MRTAARAALLAAVSVACAGCTDAATRVAYDVETGAKALGASADGGLTVRHEPSRFPEGCGGDFSLEIGRGRSGEPDKGSITVKCAGPGLWYTTYHLNFVVVPSTVRAAKRAGEPVLIDLEKRGADIALVRIR